MNVRIKEILEKVQLGELSDTEAEKQYQELIDTKYRQDAASIASYVEETFFEEEDKNLASFQDKITYTQRTIEVVKEVENPEFRLFVFLPFGFGNETVSWSWRNSFEDKDNVEVWLIGASDISDWQQLIVHLVEKMAPLCDIPFVVYGHSMGGIVAYEALVELEQRYQLSPIVFIPSSVAPPGIFERMKVLPPIYEIDHKLDMLDCRALLEKSQVILPLKSGVKPMSDDAIRCDIELVKTYCYRHGKTPLSCPVLALQANNDILVKDPVTLSLWKDYTKGYFCFQEVEGTHLYFMNPPQSFFRTIKSFLQKEYVFKQFSFEPKTYRLVSFETGTEEVNVYPYGINPKGYLIYQPDGKMAAHLWNSSRCINDNAETTHISSKDHAVEMMLTYLSYSGDYHVKQGVIKHSVHVSTDPNFVDDILIRYYHVHNRNITLVTAPLTTKNLRQSKTSTYSQLVWEEVKGLGKYAGHPLIGSWVLNSYKDNDGHVFGECPKGVLILTKEGYFSMVGIRQNRNQPRYDNLILASDEEIYDAIQSSRSYCGRFEILDKKTVTFFIEAGVFDTTPKKIKMLFEFSEQKLEIRWTWEEPETGKLHCVAETWTKEGKSKKIEVSMT